MSNDQNTARACLGRSCFAIVLLALVGGCAGSSEPPIAFDGERITYETSPGPFCGRCDTLKLTAAPDGRVWIERGYWAGDYENWRTKHHRIDVTPKQFAAFRASLQRYRPQGDLWLSAIPPCKVFQPDLPDIKVTWQDGLGRSELIYNLGCDRVEQAEMAAALKSAPALLEILDLNAPD